MKAVIAAAGEGIRLRPHTLTKPKHLLPVGGKPLLVHILASLKEVGFDEVMIVIGYEGKTIQETLGNGSSFGLNITYAKQRGAYGTGWALTFAEEFVANNSFLLIYGDLYVEPKALNRVIKAFRRRRSEAVMAVMEIENPEDYGIVELDSQKRLIDFLRSQLNLNQIWRTREFTSCPPVSLGR